MAFRFYNFLLCCLLALNTASVQANFESALSGGDNFLPVEEAYQLDVSTLNDKAILIFSTANNYFLYQHGFKIEWINNSNAVEADFSLPAGIKKNDEYFGPVEVYYGQVLLELTLPAYDATLKVSSQGCADAGLCYPPYDLYFSYNSTNKTFITIENPSISNHTAAVTINTPDDKPNQADNKQSLLLAILLSAFLGGLILNLMPCVLPVLSIKLLQLLQKEDHKTQHLGLAYFSGVVLSFIAVAAILIGLRSAGHALGWGFQLQQPAFVASLIYLFFIMSLSMAGVIEFGQRFMGVGNKLTQASGLKGSFFTGVLAVIVASPCTAPFMGTATGYALSQNNATALLIFAVLGAGMATPLTLITFFPNAYKVLPKPGAWMQTLKEFFAFPLLATAIWLLWVLGNQTGSNGPALVLLGCMAFGFALWAIKKTSNLLKALGLGAFIAATLIPFSDHLSSKPANYTGEHIAYSEEKLTQYRRDGQAVFIDLTADWCITCLANKKTTLETDTVQQAFKNANIIYMVGDWTNYNAEITALLSRYGRSGIPLYLLYPPIADAPAVILPQLLNEQIILDAIENNSK